MKDKPKLVPLDKLNAIMVKEVKEGLQELAVIFAHHPGVSFNDFFLFIQGKDELEGLLDQLAKQCNGNA